MKLVYKETSKSHLLLALLLYFYKIGNENEFPSLASTS